MVWIFYVLLTAIGVVGLVLTIKAAVYSYRTHPFDNPFEKFFSAFLTFTVGFCSTAICVCCICLITLLIILMCGGF